MKLLGSCFLAFAMYSKIPMPQPAWDKKEMETVFCFFPLIGAVVGAVLLGWWKLAAWLGLAPMLTAAGCLMLPLLLTGGIHLDGFCDTSDALASHQSRERKLEILKDSNVGAFALINCVCYLLVQFAAWGQAAADGAEILVLALVPVLSRTLSGLAAVSWKNARGTGLLATFTEAQTGQMVRIVLVVWLLLCAGLLCWVHLVYGLVVLLAAGVMFWYYSHLSSKEFGGITGDLAGWFLQLCELVCLLAVVLTGRVVAIL